MAVFVYSEVKEMTLAELIGVLKTQNINVTVKDGANDTEIIVFKSQGINGVEGEISARPVRRWEITGATAIEVVLDATAG